MLADEDDSPSTLEVLSENGGVGSRALGSLIMVFKGVLLEETGSNAEGVAVVDGMLLEDEMDSNGVGLGVISVSLEDGTGSSGVVAGVVVAPNKGVGAGVNDGDDDVSPEVSATMTASFIPPSQ